MAEQFNGSRLDRMEQKLDKMNENIILLARIDERMLSHMEQQKRLSIRLESVERGVDELRISRAKFLGIIACVSCLASLVGPFLTTLFLDKL